MAQFHKGRNSDKYNQTPLLGLGSESSNNNVDDLIKPYGLQCQDQPRIII